MVFERALRKMAKTLVDFKDGHHGITSYKRDFNNFLKKDLEAMREESFRNLEKIIYHTYTTSPHYREAWDRIGFKPSDLRCSEEIQNIPLLTKGIIEKHKDQMISANFKKEELEISYTGGSSGTPTSFYRDKKATAQRIGRQLGILELCGYLAGDRCGLIWGAHQDIGDTHSALTLKARFRKFLSGKEVLDCSAMNSESLRDYHQKLKRFKPTVLYGYPNAMGQFATFIKENNYDPIRVKTIISTAERLSEDQRKLIQEVFEGEVYNLYCTREHGCIAFECKKHAGFHLDIGSVHLEIVSNGVPVKPGQTGEIVVTDLLNYGMPFIRNRIGDRGSLSTKACDCGCNLPLLNNLDGRVADLLYRPDGSTVAGVMLVDMFLDMPSIKAMQIIQEKLDEVSLFLVVTEEYSKEIEKKAVYELSTYMGKETKVNLQIVPEIPRNPVSGKYQEVICKINPPK